MAKSTLNKALASLRFKYVDLKERFELLVDRAAKQCVELGSLRANYTLATRLNRQLLDENKRLKESDIGSLQAQVAGLESRLTNLISANDRLLLDRGRHLQTIRDQQNENAKLRNKLEETSSNAWVFGVLAVLAAAAAGIAYQHWFPINF